MLSIKVSVVQELKTEQILKDEKIRTFNVNYIYNKQVKETSSRYKSKKKKRTIFHSLTKHKST